MKKLLALVLALALCLGLAGVTTAGEAADIDLSEHVTITWLVTGDIPTENKTNEVLEVFNQRLTEVLNAELRIEWIEWTDWQTRYNMALAVQDGSIDLVGTATDWLYTWENAQKGALMPITEEMLSTYAPKTWASVPAENWELCKYNGQIYVIPEDNYAQWINHGYLYRGDWAAEAGLEEGVHSWEDLGVYFQYIKDNLEDVIPWDAAASGSSLSTQMASGWLSSHSGAIGIEGLPVDIFKGESKDNPYKLSMYYLEGDELVNFAKTMKEWNDAGYWREDVLNYSGQTDIELRDGLTGAHQHHTQTWRGERVWLSERHPGSDLSFFWFGEETQNLVKMNITHGALAIAAQSKNPERALMVYDLIRNDEEFYRMFNYGIEGQQYIIDENGYMDRPEGYHDETDKVAFNFWWGRNDDLELRNAQFDWPVYDALVDRYNECAINYPYGQVVFDITPISAELDNLSNVVNTYMPQIAFGKAADPEAFVAEFRTALKNAGVEKVYEEIEAQLAAVYGE